MQEKQVYSVNDVVQIFGYTTNAALRAAIRRGQLKLRHLRRGNTMIFTLSAIKEALDDLDSRAVLAPAAQTKIESEVAFAALEGHTGNKYRQIGSEESNNAFLQKYALKQSAKQRMNRS